MPKSQTLHVVSKDWTRAGLDPAKKHSQDGSAKSKRRATDPERVMDVILLVLGGVTALMFVLLVQFIRDDMLR